MPTKIWIVLLGLVSQFVTCAEQHVQRFAPAGAGPHSQARLAAIAGKDVIVVAGAAGSWKQRVISRVEENGQVGSTILTPDDGLCVGEELFARGERWWYSRCGAERVEFVTAPGAAASVVKTRVADVDSREWLPFDQVEPEGVLLSSREDQRTVVVERLSAGGTYHLLGTFDRGSTDWGNQPGRALLLDEATVAVLTIETRASEPAQSSIMLRVFRDGEVSLSARVAYTENGWASFDAALNGDGDVATVAVAFSGQVVATIFNPARGEAPSPRQLSGDGGRGPYLGVRVIAIGERFASAWIRASDNAVALVEFNRSSILPEVTVAERTDGAEPAFRMQEIVRDDNHQVAFLWTGEGKLMMRRIPQPSTGYILAEGLLGQLSEWVSARKER